MNNAPLILPPAVNRPDALEQALAALTEIADEVGLDSRWEAAFAHVAEYLERPAKRVRPLLVSAGFRVAQPDTPPDAGVAQFAAGLELLHAFMLIHDDVLDRAPTRRGGPALQHLLGPGGDGLAIVAGDHLFARAIEAMLSAPTPRAAAATQHILAVCRHTAIGQYLDLALAHEPLSRVNLFETLRVATLKTARYGFVAPLVCGAMLGGAAEETIDVLTRVGRHAGLAFQLTDDLLGLFGDSAHIGKAGRADYFEAKRTFPVIAAWTRADEAGRARLEALWSEPQKTEAHAEEAVALIERFGGRRATQRAIERGMNSAQRALETLPASVGRQQLAALLAALSRRTS